MSRFIISILLFFTVMPSADTQNCPRNLYDCKGACGWFTDSDHDGYCDLTAFSDALIKKSLHNKDSVAEIQNQKNKHTADSIKNANTPVITNESVKQNNINKDKQQKENISHNCPFENTPECEKNKTTQSNITTASTLQNPHEKNTKKDFKIKKYDLALIFGLCVFFYLVSSVLARRKVFKKSTHKKIWNTLLLISFLNTGLTGLFLVIQLNYLVLFEWFSKFLFWHVEFGISMAAISILHILWHWKYFWKLLVKRNETAESN